MQWAIQEGSRSMGYIIAISYVMCNTSNKQQAT